MTPTRVTPPAGPLVGIDELKAHLRVDFVDDDSVITALEKAAVAHLDGWRGIVGRCLQSQQWSVDFLCAGRHRLPFPDVASVTVSSGTANLSHDALGSLVCISEPGTVTMTVAAPEEVVEIAKLAVKMLVAHWYQNREAASATGAVETPFAVSCLLTPIRWVVL